MGENGGNWKTLSNSPYASAPGDAGKWGDIGGVSEIGYIPPVSPEDQHRAQINTVELLKYGKGESMKFLEMLGIDRKVQKDGDSSDDRQG